MVQYTDCLCKCHTPLPGFADVHYALEKGKGACVNFPDAYACVGFKYGGGHRDTVSLRAIKQNGIDSTGGI